MGKSKSNKVYKGIRSFEKNKENPFLQQAVEQVEQNIVKKFRNSTGSTKAAILTAVDSKGNPSGHTSFVKLVEVDEDKFTKLYLANFKAFFDLKPSAIKVFGYIMSVLLPKKDEFVFILEDCQKYTGYKSHKSIHEGLAELLKAGIIARGKVEIMYYINPMVAFNGDRITFAKSYVKKKKPKEFDPQQTDILTQIAEKEAENGNY